MSWFQSEPELSLELIDLLGISPSTAVVDVGGGASSLVDRLVKRGFTDISVLDISAAALEAGHRRVGESPPVQWLHEDLLVWQPGRRFGLWHDRAVFHFLTDEVDRERYLAALASGLEPGGALVMATFAEDGPEFCSGLPVLRYSSEELVDVLGRGFRAVATRRELHTTPSGVVQPFTWLAARSASN
ncbi:MAG: class I SAM-dependent methyltransferase [Acidimicrobiales bacterium]